MSSLAVGAPGPLDGAVHRGASDAEQFGEPNPRKTVRQFPDIPRHRAFTRADLAGLSSVGLSGVNAYSVLHVCRGRRGFGLRDDDVVIGLRPSAVAAMS